MWVFTGFLISYIFYSQNFASFNNAFDFVRYQDTVFVATSGGVVKFNPRSLVTYSDSASLELKVLTMSHGLRSNKVKSVTMDSEGNLWVATEDEGIHVKPKDFDKFEYYPFPLVSLKRTRVLEFFPPDFILLGTPYGLFVAETKGNLDPSDDRLYPPLIIRDTVSLLVRGDNFVYVVSGSNVFGWTPDSTFRINLPVVRGVIKALAEANGKLVYATGNTLVFASADTVLTFNLSGVLSITYLSDTFYISSSYGFYKLFSNRLTRVNTYRTALVIPTDSFHVLTSYSVNRENTFFAPSWRILKGDSVYVLKQSIPFNLMTSMAYKKGILACGILYWVTDTLGLKSKAFILRNGSVQLCESLTTIAHAVRTVAIDDSMRIWVGTYSDFEYGIYIFDTTGRFLEKIDNLPRNIICHLAISRDTVVALWQKGIYRIHRTENGYTWEEIYKVDYPFFLTHGSQGTYLIGTENEGLIKIDSAGNVILRITPSELNSAMVSVAKERGSSIYIGAPSGLFKYGNLGLQKLLDGVVRDLEFYKDYLVVLQDSQLVILKDDRAIMQFNSSNSNIGKMDEQFYMIRDVLEIGERGEIYAGGEEGVSMLRIYFPEENKKSLRVFPNPCKIGGIISVESNSRPLVYDLSLTPIKVGFEKRGELYVSEPLNLPPGPYLVYGDGGKSALLILKED